MTITEAPGRPLHATRAAVALLTVLLILGALLPARVAAQAATPTGSGPAASCVPEQEPNDATDGALPAYNGAVCLAGTLAGADQDLATWEAGGDLRATWTVRLSGVPGRLTLAELRPITSDPGVQPPAIGGPILALRADETAAGAIVASDLLTPPGRYLVGVTTGGSSGPSDPAAPAGGYSLAIEPGAPLPVPGDLEPNDADGEATPVIGPFALGGDLQGSPDRYRWTIGVGDAVLGRAWRLEVRTPLGAPSRLSLIDAGGSLMATTAADDLGMAALDDLVLAAGTYTVVLDPSASAPLPYALAATVGPGPRGDPEPDDGAATAIDLDPARPVAKGRLSRPDDRDVYRLTLDAEHAASSLDVRLVWPSDRRRRLCLSDADGAPIQCREATDDLLLSGLGLSAGTYLLDVSGDAAPDEPYILRVDVAAPLPPDFEHEPNDAATAATPMDAGAAMRGRAGAHDEDHFRVSTTGDPQLWRVDAIGPGLEALEWVRPDGTRLGTGQVAEDDAGAVLTDLYLDPGEHWLRLVGSGGDYTLALTPLGPPDPDAEREPNDTTAFADHLRVGDRRVGRLPTAADGDTFTFTLAATEHVLIAVDAPRNGDVAVSLTDDAGLMRSMRATASAPLRADLLLPAGDYTLALRADHPSEDRYALRLERLDPFIIAADQEPNDDPWRGRPFPTSGVVHGTAEAGSDLDWFGLAPSVDGTPLTLTVTGSVTGVALSDGTSELPLTSDQDGITFRSTPLPVGAPLFLRVGATGDYAVRLGGDAPAGRPSATAAPPPEGTPGVAASLELHLLLDTAPAAFWPLAQRLEGTLAVQNTGPTDASLDLDALVSDDRWSVVLDPSTLVASAGAGVSAAVTGKVAPGAPADDPVRLTVRARADDGSQRTASADLVPDREAAPIGPVQRHPIPDALLGGLDVASLALGAVPVTSLDADGEARLHDGFAATDWGLSWPIGALPVTLTVDLAGDEPVPVAGTILHPLSDDLSMGDSPRVFQLALSIDGATWTTVLDGTLQRVAHEQAFVLPAPVPARFAQLRVISTQRGTSSRLELGEWKVVADQRFAPAGGPIDLADPTAGGHVVRMRPLPGSGAEAQGMLAADPAADGVPVVVPMERGTAPELVIGFMDDRAARIEALEWRDAPGSDPTARIGRVNVSVSIDSPLGPWRDIGEWRLDRAADGSVGPFRPDPPVWARFVRLSGPAPSRKADRLELPAVVRVLESAPDGAAYRSALGQWGVGVRAGPMEWLAQADASLAVVRDPDDDGPAQPRPLAIGGAAAGVVHRGRDSDWYTVTIPDGQNTLALTLSGSPVVGTALAVTDAAGTSVPVTFGPGEEAGTVTYLAPVRPGEAYRVEVSQPPASVAFTFDTSVSVATQMEGIRNGLASFAGGIEPGAEVVKVLPFDGRPLLPDWSDDRYAIRGAVDAYVMGVSSSAAEANLAAAATDLAAREGARAVLLVTDAASSSYDRTGDLWAALDTVRPLVFAVEVGGEGEAPAVERHHLMVDWATSTGGAYRHARSGADIVAAFDELATWLRRPQAYRLTASARADRLPPPEPGRLRVTSPPAADGRPSVVTAPDAAIELVLDTSGSMLERLGPRRRIDVAKAVLRDLLHTGLPAGSPVALRTFDTRPGSCDTRLAVPLGPLDPAGMSRVIDAIAFPGSVKTPLAKAIAAVADDLAGVTGPRIVVVVTDGRESCGGDPAAATRGLREAGIDVTVNVVGLALDRASRAAIRKLAGIGGGSYFDAQDPAQLADALRRAVSAPFRVLDAAGQVVAAGTVNGDGVDLPPGRYTVVVRSDPEVRFEDVRIDEDADVELVVSGTPNARAGG